MKLTLLLAAGLGILVLARAPRADADCARPQVGFSPASGATVPPRPTIYVFVPRDVTILEPATVTVGGAGAIVESVSKSPAYEVVRVRVFAHDPGQEFTVQWSPSEGKPRNRASYRVGDAPPNEARVVGVSREEHHWTCSFNDTIRLELTGTAAAYRVGWADGSTTVVPADDGVMWPSDEAPENRPGSAGLGHLNCMGNSVDPEALVHPRAFDLYALFSDGSELRLGSSVAQLGEHGLRLPTELVNAARDARESFIATPLVAPPWWTAALGAMGGAVALLGAALLRRRRGRDHAPRHLPRRP